MIKNKWKAFSALIGGASVASMAIVTPIVLTQARHITEKSGGEKKVPTIPTKVIKAGKGEILPPEPWPNEAQEIIDQLSKKNGELIAEVKRLQDTILENDEFLVWVWQQNDRLEASDRNKGLEIKKLKTKAKKQKASFDQLLYETKIGAKERLDQARGDSQKLKLQINFLFDQLIKKQKAPSPVQENIQKLKDTIARLKRHIKDLINGKLIVKQVKVLGSNKIHFSISFEYQKEGVAKPKIIRNFHHFSIEKGSK